MKFVANLFSQESKKKVICKMMFFEILKHPIDLLNKINC